MYKIITKSLYLKRYTSVPNSKDNSKAYYKLVWLLYFCYPTLFFVFH